MTTTKPKALSKLARWTPRGTKDFSFGVCNVRACVFQKDGTTTWVWETSLYVRHNFTASRILVLEGEADDRDGAKGAADATVDQFPAAIAEHGVVAQVLEVLSALTWDWKYSRCRVCDGPVSEADEAYAIRKVQQTTCSTACGRREIVLTYGCCPKAELKGCVCLHAFVCPDHGERHVGTHD